MTMKTTITIAAGLLCSSFAPAALYTSGSAWTAVPGLYQPGAEDLHVHLDDEPNYYANPDHSFNRTAAGTTLSYNLFGGDTIELLALAKNAANTHYFGVRVETLSGDFFEMTLSPTTNQLDNPLSINAFPRYFTTSVDSILAASGFGPLAIGDQAKVDFFLSVENFFGSPNLYSSGTPITNPNFPANPVYDYTQELLNPAMIIDPAAPLDNPSAAYSLLADHGWEVWGFEDRVEVRQGELDYNDFMFAVKIVPVPEPSTYGLIGAAALIGLIAQRRFKMKKA